MENTIKTTQFNKQNFRVFNENGERVFEVAGLIEYLEKREGKGLVRDLCSMIGEERRDLLEQCFAIIGKNLFLKLVEKTLIIQNEGGVEKNNVGKELINEKKTAGGVLFSLIKKEGVIGKNQLKEIFKKDYHAINQRKKLVKKMENLLID
jgi:hypothetical protein